MLFENEVGINLICLQLQSCRLLGNAHRQINLKISEISSTGFKIRLFQESYAIV